MRTTRSSVLPRPAATITVVIAVVVAALAFALSYVALADLANRAGQPDLLAQAWPLVVDGTIVGATVALWAQAKAPPRDRRYAWALLAGALTVSVAGNVAHALFIAEITVPRAVAAFVAVAPPAALVAVTHLALVLLGRTPGERRARPSRSPTVQPTLVPVSGHHTPAGQSGEPSNLSCWVFSGQGF